MGGWAGIRRGIGKESGSCEEALGKAIWNTSRSELVGVFERGTWRGTWKERGSAEAIGKEMRSGTCASYKETHIV
jgi:hypothetical protein